MPNRRTRRAKKEPARSPTSVLRGINEQFTMGKDSIDTVVDSRFLMRTQEDARDSRVFGLEHAIQVILGERKACQVARKIYEAGLLICMSVFVECARDNRVFTKFMRNFEPWAGIAISNFSFRFNVVLRRANKISNIIPKRLSVDTLPADAFDYWKTRRGRVMQAIKCIEFDYVEDETSYVDDHHARSAVSVLASNGPTGRISILAECSICYNVDMTQLRRCGDECSYITCNSCYDELNECPFCGTAWNSRLNLLHSAHI